jgi:hypothetical protein
MIFRREPIHKKLARQARLDAEPVAEPTVGPEAETRGLWGIGDIHGVQRPRRWDVVGSVEAPDLTGDEVHFVVLPNGDVVVDEDVPGNALSPLADAIEETLQPPYRGEAVRRDGAIWAVAARRIDVAEAEAPGDELELVVNQGARALSVDGKREFGSIAELEQWGDRLGDSYVVRARRLDGRLWEVEASPL